MIGQVVLGKYKVLRALDQGGMSKIYLARQLGQDRDAEFKQWEWVRVVVVVVMV